MKSQDLFCDLLPPLDLKKAQIEASRCYYCYDAPCIQACPTEIDIPSFIRKISNNNIKGAALDILGANIMGGTCARACPVETLCQQACVREKSEAQPVQIGQLQRYATDEYFKMKEQPFQRASSQGKKIAVVGAGPAGLSCAHRLSRLGYEITVYETRAKAGGLNEYGLAPYKLTDHFAQKEVDFILSLGGIHIEFNKMLGRDFTLSDLQAQFSAVFLGIGLGGVRSLGIPGENLQGVEDAVKMIERIRQAKDLKQIPVSSHVVIIGGGNTAVDMAIQMKRLGAEFVSLVYRRGPADMSATVHEQELAKKEGVQILSWLQPIKIEGSPAGAVQSLQFEYTKNQNGKLVGTGKYLSLQAEQVFKAIGQTLTPELEKNLGLPLASGKLFVNEIFETPLAKVFAGGDCTGRGEDLTVTAVQQGKRAALAIHQKLQGETHG